MTVRKVPQFKDPRSFVKIEDQATVGATLGVDLVYPDGSLVKLSDFGTATPADPPNTQYSPASSEAAILDLAQKYADSLILATQIFGS